MRLFRGCRHPNGRADVLVCGPDGETWLRGLHPLENKGKLQYQWGSDGPGARLLALHLLESILPDPEIAADLTEALATGWIALIELDRFAIPDWELTDWVIEELTMRIDALRSASGRMPPCNPSEN